MALLNLGSFKDLNFFLFALLKKSKTPIRKTSEIIRRTSQKLNNTRRRMMRSISGGKRKRRLSQKGQKGGFVRSGSVQHFPCKNTEANASIPTVHDKMNQVMEDNSNPLCGV